MRRNTSQRSAIEEVFKQQERPLSFDEVLSYGCKLVKSLNQATVYHNLKRLMDDSLLNFISNYIFGTLYKLTDKEHHHHFHCHKCNRAF